MNIKNLDGEAKIAKKFPCLNQVEKLEYRIIMKKGNGNGCEDN